MDGGSTDRGHVGWPLSRSKDAREKDGEGVKEEKHNQDTVGKEKMEDKTHCKKEKQDETHRKNSLSYNGAGVKVSIGSSLELEEESVS